MSLGNADINRLFAPGVNKKYILNVEDIDPGRDNSSAAYIVNTVTNGSFVLDAGCSYGYLGEWLARNKNCKVYGIDINDEAVEFVKKQGYYEDIFRFDLDSPERFHEETGRFKQLGQTFDFIICANVLEHLKGPTEALFLLGDKLKSGGAVLAGVPNVANIDIILNLLEGRFNYSEFGILDNTHLRFFTRRSFAEWICFANEAFVNFKFDLDLIGTVEYISPFAEEVKKRYPAVYDLIARNDKDFEVILFLFKLTKLSGKNAPKRLLDFLQKKDGSMIDKIDRILRREGNSAH